MRLILWYIGLGSFAVSCTGCGVAALALGLTQIGVILVTVGVFCAISIAATFVYQQPRRRVAPAERVYVGV